MLNKDEMITIGQRRRAEALESNDSRKRLVADAAAEKQSINRLFAELFEGDEDATARAVADRLQVPLSRVEESNAFSSAYSGNDVAEIRRCYL